VGKKIPRRSDIFSLKKSNLIVKNTNKKPVILPVPTALSAPHFKPSTSVWGCYLMKLRERESQIEVMEVAL
jgi:hypothetical protein